MSSPSQASLEVLFASIQSTFPASLGSETWYLVVISSLISISHPSRIEDIYKYIISQDAFKTAEKRKLLSRRLRDTLLKTWTLTGIPPVVTAFVTLAAIEAPEDVDETSEQTHQQLDRTLYQRGEAFMQSIYRSNLEPIMAKTGSHRGAFDWLEKNIIYGLFLSDHTELSKTAVLSAVEAELVTLTAIMCRQSDGDGAGRSPTIWHVRGSRRLGVGKEDLEKVLECVESVAKWAGKSTDGWVQVQDVELEV